MLTENNEKQFYNFLIKEYLENYHYSWDNIIKQTHLTNHSIHDSRGLLHRELGSQTLHLLIQNYFECSQVVRQLDNSVHILIIFQKLQKYFILSFYFSESENLKLFSPIYLILLFFWSNGVLKNHFLENKDV